MTESRASLVARFRAAWAAHDPAITAETLPAWLARAVVTVLPVDGAGLSLFLDGFRVPVGASDDDASAAERLQFTVDQGPCLDSARDQRLVVAGAEELLERWPEFAEQLFAKTRYRAAIAIPLPFTTQMRGALNLMFVDPRGLDGISVAAASAVSGEIVDALTLGQAFADQTSAQESSVGRAAEQPEWLSVSPGRDRAGVWVASGVLMTQLDVTADDALALMRSFAYTQDLVLDEVAAAILERRLAADDLAP